MLVVSCHQHLIWSTSRHLWRHQKKKIRFDDGLCVCHGGRQFCALAFQPTTEQRQGREVHLSSLDCISVVLMCAPAIMDTAIERDEAPNVWRAVRG
ncbi:hypothetical protein HRG_014113 [Hirsutella rhossiliensis]